jgi:PTH1 family peptidyl-tRNA hydrolase
MGIGLPPPQWDAVDYVLSKFTTDERREIDGAISTAAKALEDWVSHGIDFCMNRYNNM